MKSIRKYIKRYWWIYCLGTLAMIISVSLDLYSPQVTRQIIDDVIVAGNTSYLKKMLIALVIIGVGRVIFQYVKELLFDYGSTKVALGIRKDLFCHIEYLSIPFFQKTNTGVLMARVKDDVDKLWCLTSYVSMLVIEVVIHCLLVMTCMFLLNPFLAILPLLIVPAVGIMAIKMERKLDRTYGEVSEENVALNTIAQENLGGVRTVKSFAREEFEIHKFQKSNKKYLELNLKLVNTVANYYPNIQFCTRMLLVIVVLFGGILTMYGKMTIGELGAFIGYTNVLTWPLDIIGWLVKDVAAAIASDKKIQKILDITPEIKETENPIPLERAKGTIEFQNVTFGGKKEHIIKDVSFYLGKGKTMGIMGATGSGKSTIVDLIERFYDPESGKILLDGKDVKEFSIKDVRKNIALVMQDVFLFSDTVEENIQMGSYYDLNSKEIRRVAKQAQANDFVESMEEDYQTVIGERGVGLSGGQKQRLSIARALAKKAPILILDDSTSALDTETEKRIQQELKKLKDTTKIIVAHRISAVRHADNIIYLKDGEIAEQGTHEELMEQQGLYYDTYQVQYSANENSICTA